MLKFLIFICIEFFDCLLIQTCQKTHQLLILLYSILHTLALSHCLSLRNLISIIVLWVRYNHILRLYIRVCTWANHSITTHFIALFIDLFLWWCILGLLLWWLKFLGAGWFGILCCKLAIFLLRYWFSLLIWVIHILHLLRYVLSHVESLSFSLKLLSILKHANRWLRCHDGTLVLR